MYMPRGSYNSSFFFFFFFKAPIQALVKYDNDISVGYQNLLPIQLDTFLLKKTKQTFVRLQVSHLAQVLQGGE